MRKTLATRIIAIAFLYFAVFCFLVIIQFSGKGNFSLSTGGMNIRGRFALTQKENVPDADDLENAQKLTGGIKIFYGGLEFNLKEERGKGFTLTGEKGVFTADPDSMTLTDNSARFIFSGENSGEDSGGTVITFNTIDSARGLELQITAEFADNVSEVSIPITTRRSSLIRENGQIGLIYNGLRYMFSGAKNELENGFLSLSRENSFISYRSRDKQSIFDPADYITAQSENYETVIRNWQDQSYANWNRNAQALQNEDDVIAYCAQALARGSYIAAVSSVPRSFINSTNQSYRSSVYVGGMRNAFLSITAAESSRLSLINRLTRERSPELLKEEHLLDFLFTRNNTVLVNEVLNIVNNMEPEILNSDYIPGLLEIYEDLKRWRPALNNPIERLTEQILFVISENLIRDNENDLVYASSSGGIDYDYTIRLGRVLAYWADAIQKTEWAAIGRSLVLSAVASGSAGKNLVTLNLGDYYPRAALLNDSGLWAWTISPVLRASYIEGNINIAASFVTGAAHHVILTGVQPFIKIQIHGMDWRTDSQFENYDSSGWVYYPQNQILIIKLRHRAAIENVRIFYRVEAPPPPVIEEAPPEADIFDDDA